MILLLYGNDSLRIARRQLEIINEYFNDSDDPNISIFENVLDIERISDAILSSPFLASKRLVILKNLLKSKADEVKLLQLLENIPETTVVVVILEEEIDRRSSLIKKLLLNSEEISLPKGIKLEEWVKDEVQQIGGEIEQKNIIFFLNWLGEVELWQLKNELEKLITLDPVITEDNIRQLVQPNINSNIFNLIDAISNKKRREAFKVYSELTEKGENELYLLTMIQRQIRNLTLIWNLKKSGKTEGEIIKELKLHPYVIKKALWASSKIPNFEVLQVFYRQTVETEKDIKSGAKEPGVALELLIARLCG